MLFLLGLALTAVSALDVDATKLSHVVVIPDIHGDRDALLRSLWLAIKQVDSEHSLLEYERMAEAFQAMEYEGPKLSFKENVVLVQLGDVLDRGPYGIEIFRILSGIPHVIGWKYVQLYGNHEILNFVNEADRFLHPRETELLQLQDRKSLFSHGGPLRTRITDISLGMLRLVGPGTASTLFVHGGLDLDWIESELGINDGDVYNINLLIADMAKSDDSIEVNRLNSGDSLVWTRALAQQPESIACLLVQRILERFKVHRIVVGHTPQEDMRAKTRCAGKIVLTDVMMSRWMLTRDVDESSNTGGRPVAVILKIHQEGGNLESMIAHYTDLSGGHEEAVNLLPPFESEPEPVDALARSDRLLDFEGVLMLDPILTKLVQYRPEQRIGVFESKFVGAWGMTHVVLRDSIISEELIGKISNALQIDVPLVEAMDTPLVFRDVYFEEKSPYFFLDPDCEDGILFVRHLETTSPAFKFLFAKKVSHTVARLHEIGLVLGLSDLDTLGSVFAVCADNQTFVFLADWSTIRPATDVAETRAERERLDLSLQLMLS
jgi:hypothetical protein